MKRAFDIIASSVLLLVLSPVLIVLAIAVRVGLGSPVLFRQPRAGYQGEIFTLIKFRTMLERNDENGKPLPDEQRQSRFGSFLRSTSLDELPELINILRGEMSFVGPRPLLVEYLPLYNAHQARRHEARPGLTGWSVVNGRNRISWEEKFDLDVWYVDHQSFFLDIKILFKTVGAVLGAKDINPHEQKTVRPFTGSSK